MRMEESTEEREESESESDASPSASGGGVFRSRVWLRVVVVVVVVVVALVVSRLLVPWWSAYRTETVRLRVVTGIEHRLMYCREPSASNG